MDGSCGHGVVCSPCQTRSHLLDHKRGKCRWSGRLARLHETRRAAPKLLLTLLVCEACGGPTHSKPPAQLLAEEASLECEDAVLGGEGEGVLPCRSS